MPGDAVTVYGVIRCMPTSGGMSAGERQAPSRSLYILFLEARSSQNRDSLPGFLEAVAQKTGTQNGTLVSGNMDQHPLFNFEPYPGLQPFRKEHIGGKCKVCTSLANQFRK